MKTQILEEIWDVLQGPLEMGPSFDPVWYRREVWSKGLTYAPEPEMCIIKPPPEASAAEFGNRFAEGLILDPKHSGMTHPEMNNGAGELEASGVHPHHFPREARKSQRSMGNEWDDAF